MINLAIALVSGTVVTLIFGYSLGATGFSIWYGIAPGLITAIGAYIFLARRIFKKVQDLASEAQQLAQGAQSPKSRNIDQAVKTLKQGYDYAKWQFLVQSQIDAQIGTILYSAQKFDQAENYLKGAIAKNWVAKTMLGTLYYKKKKFDKMEEAFEEAVVANKKQALAWNIYAYCLWKSRKRDKAIEVLNRALEKIDDERTESNLKALKNNRRMKMRKWGGQWYQFHLDKPPQKQMRGGGGRRQMRG